MKFLELKAVDELVQMLEAETNNLYIECSVGSLQPA
jgi:hypothetical protein